MSRFTSFSLAAVVCLRSIISVQSLVEYLITRKKVMSVWQCEKSDARDVGFERIDEKERGFQE